VIYFGSPFSSALQLPILGSLLTVRIQMKASCPRPGLVVTDTVAHQDIDASVGTTVYRCCDLSLCSCCFL